MPRGRLFDMQRRVVATKTTEAWQRVPHVSFLFEPDVTEFLEIYRGNRQIDGLRITLNTVLVKVITEGLKAAPQLNAYVRYNHAKSEGSVEVVPDINIALPWMTRGGKMITPTVFGCNDKSLPQLQRAIDDLRRRVDATHVEELLLSSARTEARRHLARLDFSYLPKVIASTITMHPVQALKGAPKRDYYARPSSGRLEPHDLLGATVSVSNIGSLLPGVRGHFNMLQIIEPQVFVVGLNPPHVEEFAGRERTILPITLVFDHRALDFSHLVDFIRRCEELFAAGPEVRDWYRSGAGSSAAGPVDATA